MQFVEIPPLNPLIQPHARSGHRAVATESDLWIWGGYHPSTADSQAPQMFDEVDKRFDQFIFSFLFFSFGDLISLCNNGHSRQQPVMDQL
jgi:hypothetical protein